MSIYFYNMINTVNGFSDNVNNKINFILNIVKKNLSTFIKFLLEKNIVQMGIGLIIAIQVKSLIDNISNNFLNPIVAKIVPPKDSPAGNLQKNIFGINFNYGQIFIEFINFIVMLVLVYLMWQTSKMDLSFIDPALNSIGNSKNNGVTVSV